jgi:hypothetical protein
VVWQVAEENWNSAPLEVVEEPPKKKGLFQDDMDLDERTSHTRIYIIICREIQDNDSCVGRGVCTAEVVAVRVGEGWY